MVTILTALLAVLAAAVTVMALGMALCGALWIVALFYGWQTMRREDRALRRLRARKHRRAEFRRLIELMESGAPAPRLTDVR